ncbi:hypothetical protein GCM10020331_085990 [Ectobacillus funiculus]
MEFFLTGHADIEQGLNALSIYNIPYIFFVTLGAEGSYVAAGKDMSKVSAMKVQAVDTTGAGDAYVSGILYSFHEFDGAAATVSDLEKFAKIRECVWWLGSIEKKVR